MVAHSPVQALMGFRLDIETSAVVERLTHRGQEDTRMSRRHATVDVHQGMLRVRDGSDTGGGWSPSANGTWVNEGQTDAKYLEPGDWFRTGRTVWVAVRNAAPPAAGTLFDGVGPAIGAIRSEIEVVAAQTATRLKQGRPVTQSMLVVGERGTGKQLVAREAKRWLDEKLGRNVPFVTLAAPALTASTAAADLFGVSEGYATGVVARAGVFEQADGGVLLIDEIADTPVEEQAKLLTVLQEREVARLGSSTTRKFDTLVIAATNQTWPPPNLRADLADRIARFRVRVPTLDERPEDTFFVFRALLAKHAPNLTINHHALVLLASRGWPGNVRELDAAAERAAAYAESAGSSAVETEHLERALAHMKTNIATGGPRTGSSETPSTRRSNPPRDELIRVLESVEWNKAAAARHFGTTSRQLRRWLAYANIDG